MTKLSRSPGRARGGQRLGRPGHWVRAAVDNPVEIEEGDVVACCQHQVGIDQGSVIRPVVNAGGQGGQAHRRALSAARAPRRAVA